MLDPLEVPSSDYWFLSGPMSDRPNLNRDAFYEAAYCLRAADYTIVTPLELKVNQSFAPHGTRGGREALAGDACLIMHERCKGVIVLEGWEESKGAKFETYIATEFDKPIYAYMPDGLLVFIPNRAEHLGAYEARKVMEDFKRSMSDLLRPTREAVKFASPVEDAPAPLNADADGSKRAARTLNPQVDHVERLRQRAEALGLSPYGPIH